MKLNPNQNQNSKKTRDLPNLSECQSCNFRIDICSGNTTLHTLYSEWRIILLCKDCFFRVESSQICSYCFKESSLQNPCISCSQCNRIVHQSCVLDCGFVAPWSYCCCSSDSFTCIDCWIPKSLANKRRVSRSGKKRKFLESRSFKECYEKKSMEAAAVARELAVRKALIARGALELASNELDLLAKEGNCGAGAGGKHDGNAQLGIQLHRAMDSSLRIVKKFRAVNSSSLSKRRLPECNDQAMAKLSGPKISCGSAGRQLVCGISRNLIRNALKHADYLTSNGANTLRMKQTDNVVNSELPSKEGEERCSTSKLINSSADYYSANSGPQYFGQGHEVLIPKGERCYIKHDPYLMKYSRRKLNRKSIPDSMPLSFSECIQHETQPFANEPLQPCLKESTIFPNSLQCSSPKVSFCSSGLSPQHYRKGNVMTLPEDDRCCQQPDQYLMKYSRRKLPIQCLMKYSRRKLNKRNRAGTLRMRESVNVENPQLQLEEGEEGCYSKRIKSSVDDKNMSADSQSFREENKIMVPEDERCCSHPDWYLMKYSRRKLNKSNGAAMLWMRETANDQNPLSQPKEGEQSYSNMLINATVDYKIMNSASLSCWEVNEVMIPEDERFCRFPDRYLMQCHRRKLADRYLMKYSRRKLYKRNVADTPRMRQTTNVESLESQQKGGRGELV